MSQSVIFVILGFLVHLQHVLGQNSGGMGTIGLALEAGNVCANGALHLSREIGRPPKIENYWDGVFYFDLWPNIREVRLTVTLDAPARMEIDPDVARVRVTGRSFYITTFEAPPKIDRVKFTVRGRTGGKFPNVASVYLNDEDVCPHPQPFSATILGVRSDQQTGDFDGVTRVDANGCGRRKIAHQGLITFGAETHPGDFPWHTAIYHREGQRRSYKCGGTIINSHTILTAGHCVHEGRSLITAERIIVQVGKYHLNVADDTAKEFRVFSIISHPHYDTSLLTNDIALLRLVREMRFTDHIQPICLWPASATTLSDVEHRVATAVGWGYTENDTVADVLRRTEIPIVPTLQCLESDRDFFGFFLTDTNFCAGYLNGTNVCSGDSGGSLAFEDEENKVWRIRGIVSLSTRRQDKAICNPKHYVLFTDVAKYLPWIEQESSQV